jgi:hypothetical protein
MSDDESLFVEDVETEPEEETTEDKEETTEDKEEPTEEHSEEEKDSDDVPEGKFRCECGVIINKSSKTSHMKTDRHKKTLDDINGRGDPDRKLKVGRPANPESYKRAKRSEYYEKNVKSKKEKRDPEEIRQVRLQNVEKARTTRMAKINEQKQMEEMVAKYFSHLPQQDDSDDEYEDDESDEDEDPKPKSKSKAKPKGKSSAKGKRIDKLESMMQLVLKAQQSAKTPAKKKDAKVKKIVKHTVIVAPEKEPKKSEEAKKSLLKLF